MRCPWPPTVSHSKLGDLVAAGDLLRAAGDGLCDHLRRVRRPLAGTASAIWVMVSPTNRGLAMVNGTAKIINDDVRQGGAEPHDMSIPSGIEKLNDSSWMRRHFRRLRGLNSMTLSASEQVSRPRYFCRREQSDWGRQSVIPLSETSSPSDEGAGAIVLAAPHQTWPIGACHQDTLPVLSSSIC